MGGVDVGRGRCREGGVHRWMWGGRGASVDVGREGEMEGEGQIDGVIDGGIACAILVAAALCCDNAQLNLKRMRKFLRVFC